MTPDEGRQGNEVTIAVNPLDPRNVIGGAKDYFPADAGECVWDGVYVTHDGGATYEDRSFDGSPWRLQSDPSSFRPNYASQFWCTTDPVAYFDVNGNLYYLLMAYQADRVTGSKTCDQECPRGALNDWAFNRATQIIAISDDGGDSFHTFTPVFEGSFPAMFHDKGWIAASADGTIHVMWLASLAGGNMYFRSTDGGQSYTGPQILSSNPSVFAGDAGQGSFLDVGTGAEVYALWTLLEPNSAIMPGLSERDRRNGFPSMATDRNPDSPNADAIYVAFQDACLEPVWRANCGSAGSGIYAMASTDKGLTFSTPVRVSEGSEKWRIFPAVSVSPGGIVDVSWMEEGKRVAPASKTFDDDKPHETLEQIYTYSNDGGQNWSAAFAVRDADDGGWDPALCHHQNGMIFIGDYNDIDSSWQAAHPIWPDSRLGPCDVFTATILRPIFATGWTPEAKAAALEWISSHPLV